MEEKKKQSAKVAKKTKPASKKTTAKKASPTKVTMSKATTTKKAVVQQKGYFPAKIEKEALQDLPRAVCTGEVRLIDNKTKLRTALKELKAFKVIGIDTETRPTFVKRHQYTVCLLQISTGEVTYLFRLNKLGLAEGLIKILSDPNIIKVGLSLKDDYRSLKKLAPFEARGFLELQLLCPGYGIRDASLQKIYAIVCGEYMSKSQRMTNWEAEELTEKQQHYAALDALACLRIYNKLQSLPKPDPTLFAMIYD